MNESLAVLEAQRDQVLEQMRSIDRLHRGTLSQHFLKKFQGGQKVTHGPYFVLQGYIKGKRFARNIPADEAAEVGRGVENYKLFQELADRFVTVTEYITELAEEKEDSKKNSRRRKSSTNGSGKPKRS